MSKTINVSLVQWIQPRKPTQDDNVGHYNGSFHRNVLEVYILASLDEVRFQTAIWLEGYNNRPHDSLGGPKSYINVRQTLLGEHPQRGLATKCISSTFNLS
ncbi:MAG: transposase [Flavobacteriales bacterium]|nr:transposase [Flavobacteriales bacterium]